MGVREKWCLRYEVGPRSIHNTYKYLCHFYVPHGGVEKTENEKQKNRNADKGAHGFTPVAGSSSKRKIILIRVLRPIVMGERRTKIYSTENVFISVGEKTQKN